MDIVWLFALANVLWYPGVDTQPRPEAPAAAEMERLVATERAFVERARKTNWRDAFLEYFADGIKGFDGEDVKDRLRRRPAPTDLEFWWEPRYGDIASSGDLGWLTGPVRTRLTQGNGGSPDFANYASIWKRQPDGRYKVVRDVGVSTPASPIFPRGFTRAPVASRYHGPERGEQGRGSLQQSDAALNARLRSSPPSSAYDPVLAPFARVHRQQMMPLTGRAAILAWAQSQPAWASAESTFAEVSQSGDLGYTCGAYSLHADGEARAESGHYLRVWSRDAGGRWHVVLDVTQPRP